MKIEKKVMTTLLLAVLLSTLVLSVEAIIDSGPVPLTVDVVDVTWTITATASAGGTISPAGPTVVTEGDDQAFTMTAAVDKYIASVTVDGALETIGSAEKYTKTYTFTSVGADHTIAVAFGTSMVSISFDPTTIGFGSVTTGTISSTKTLAVTNNGNVGVYLSASIAGGDKVFYETYLKLLDVRPDPDVWASPLASGAWHSAEVLASATENVQMRLDLTGFTGESKPYSATMTIWALGSQAPPPP